MDWPKPSAHELWRAIDTYLSAAYGGAAPPSPVRSRLEILRNAGDGPSLYASAAFEPDTAASPPQKLSLRLGNPFYPHMKLVIESSPDGAGHLFRADAHDQHIRVPPDSKEYAAFCKLAQDNQRLAQSIEAAWEQAGLPTFKQFLKRDLARRAQATGNSEPAPHGPAAPPPDIKG